MEKELYLSKLSSYYSLSVGFKAYLKFTLQETIFNKSEKISFSKSTLGACCYLVKGSARIYLYDEESEQEITILFFCIGDMVPTVNFASKHLKGSLHIEFMENAVLYHIADKHINNIHKLFQESIILTEAIAAETLERTIAAITELKLLSADQRLERLLESFPNIFNITSVKNVASYIGIHPTTLSAMRKK